jgi:hypothetical protein
MTFKTFSKESNKIVVNDNIVTDDCKEVYRDQNGIIIKDCSGDDSNDEFIHSIFAQLTSSRKMTNRLLEDFGIDYLDNMDDAYDDKIKPLMIDYNEKKSEKTKKSKKGKKKSDNKSKKVKK